MRKALLVFLPLLLLSCARKEDLPVNLNTSAGVVSPNGRYTIGKETFGSRKPVLKRTGNHVCYIKDNKTGNMQKLFGYDRYATVLWSRNGERFLTNNYEGSNISNCYLYYYEGEWKCDDVWQKLKGGGGYDEVFELSHLYIEGQKWEGDNAVVLRVKGHAGEKIKTYEAFFKCKISDGKLAFECLRQRTKR